MMTGFERYTRRRGERCFWRRWSRWCRGRELCALIEPHYPKAGNGRPPVGVERMLRDVLSAAVVQPVGPGAWKRRCTTRR